MVCRSKERGEKARNDIVARTKNENVHLHLADVSSSADVRGLAKNFMKSGEPLDVLINNAGVLFHEKTAPSKDGVEITLATNMLGGFLLTNLLLPVLMKSPDPRVILVSSGGGLTEKLTIRAAYDKAASAQPYDEALGRSLYALTKRQQIVLAEKYKEKFTKKTGVAFFSMHPGWCDTEGLQTAMPSFYNFMKDRLRTIDEGSDTIQWLAVSPNVDKEKDGGLYFRCAIPLRRAGLPLMFF
jgi:dehydrogenase/reductase SDR family member 12